MSTDVHSREGARATIHLIDDRVDFCDVFTKMLRKMGYSCDCSSSLTEGLERLQQQPAEIVFLDTHLPEGNAIDSLELLSKASGTPDVVVISANGSGESAEAAIQGGALDYLLKPIKYQTLEQLITRCLRHRQAKRSYMQHASVDRGEIIGVSGRLEQALNRVGVVARSHGNVLIVGETGTGKELFARAIHNNSDRADKAFIVVDCTNLPTSLAESILFGHAKGAFTDAKESGVGLFKQADGGTIFLDEVGDLDLSIQRSLLRVLQERSFRPLKSSREVSSDFRLVAATNRDLERMEQTGEFRTDLYYRLKTNVIALPSLRDRPEDVPELAKHYGKIICNENGLPPKKLSQEFLEGMKQYAWPGNVRDLINVMNHAVASSFGMDILSFYHLPREIRAPLVRSSFSEAAFTPILQPQQAGNDISMEILSEDGVFPTLKEVRKRVVDQMETEYLLKLLDHCVKDVKEACAVSGLSRARLYELLQKHGISMKK